MSEEKKHRSIEDISKDYGQLVYKAGSLQYEMSVKSKELEMLNDEIKNLNFEAAATQRAESELKAGEKENG